MAAAPRSLYPGQVWDALAMVENTASARVGSAIQITASVAGTVTLLLQSGNPIIVTVPVGDSIYPYQVTKATVGTATVTRYYQLFSGT